MEFHTTDVRTRRTSLTLTIRVNVNTAIEMWNIKDNIRDDVFYDFAHSIWARYSVEIQCYLLKTHYVSNGAMVLELAVILDNTNTLNKTDEILELLFANLSYIQPDSDEQEADDFEDMEFQSYLEDWE